MSDLLILADIVAYRTYYERTYCRARILTHDGIPVRFDTRTFNHAFFESSGRRGEKDVWSPTRAQRLGWIKIALEDPKMLCLQGWNAKTRSHDPKRRVTIVVDDFVVVLGLFQAQTGQVKANFITCYQADNSIAKIRSAPVWTLEAFHNADV